MKKVAIIGSRKTPKFALRVAAVLVKLFNTFGWTIVSGGAEGFDHVATQWAEKLLCYIPKNNWKPESLDVTHKVENSGNGREFISFEDSPLVQVFAAKFLAARIEKRLSIYRADMARAMGWKPFAYTAYEDMSAFVQKLKGRNMWQILGPNLESPVDLVVTWTPKGYIKGGTGTAIYLALMNNIPVVNLAIAEERIIEIHGKKYKMHGLKWAKEQCAKNGVEFPSAQESTVKVIKPEQKYISAEEKFCKEKCPHGQNCSQCAIANGTARVVLNKETGEVDMEFDM